MHDPDVYKDSMLFNLARLPSPIHLTSPLATGAGESLMRTMAIFVTSYILVYRAPNRACPGEQLA